MSRRRRNKDPHPAYRGSWPKVRRRILQRDGGVCQIQGPGCTQQATCVDHIVPVREGGEWWEPSNLRAACINCNNLRVEQTKARRRTQRTARQMPPNGSASRDW